MDKKEQQERHFVDFVRKGVPDFPAGTIIKVPDPPDLVLQEATGSVAIEVACIFQEGSAYQPSPKREDSEREQVIDRARAICAEMNIPPLGQP